MGGERASDGPDVALVLPSFGSGGAERVVLNLAAGLRRRGSSVRLLVLDGGGPLRTQVPEGVEIADLHRPRARWAGPALVRELRRRPVDLLIGSQTHVNLLLGLLRPLLHGTTRLVLREPNLLPDADARSPRDCAIGRILGRADLVLASSPAMQEHLRRSVPRPTPVVLLPNPVDVDALRDRVRQRRTPRDAPQQDTGRPLRLVTVGRLADQKAHADLFRALTRVEVPATVTVAGDGPLRGTLEGLARDLGIDERVRFRGRIDDPRELADMVATADAMIHPARYDGMPNAVLESLALGTPVIATRDLRVLRELSEEIGPEALRLVPRDGLSAAIGALSDSAPVDPPRQSLLPDRFRLENVVDSLLAAVDVLDGRDGA